MADITKNGKTALKLIFTDFLTSYNSYNIKDKIGLSNAGSLKLLRSLSEKNLLISNKVGNAIFYKPNLKSGYLLKLLEIILMENEGLPTYVKGWIEDLKILIPCTKAILLFGSILRKGKEARDVDVCFILTNSGDYRKVQSKLNVLNEKSRLKIHPLYLTESDFEMKLKENDKPVIETVKNCVVIHGHELFVRVVSNAQSQKHG